MTLSTLKSTLQRAKNYWDEGINGNHSNQSILDYIAFEVSNQESKIEYAKLTESERSILGSLLFIANINEKLQEAHNYWNESFNGDHSHSSQLMYIAIECKKAEKNIDRMNLEATERLMLNNLLILANCQ